MIITLCGSARFEPWFHLWNRCLSLAGHVVIGLSSYPALHKGQKNWYTPEDKEILDGVHKRKIDIAEAVLFLNPFAYLGESTLGEFEYAKAAGKRIFFLESWGEGCGLWSADFRGMQRMAAIRYGVPEGHGSPVATTGYGWPTDLIHETKGTSVSVDRYRRLRLVDEIGRAENDICAKAASELVAINITSHPYTPSA